MLWNYVLWIGVWLSVLRAVVDLVVGDVMVLEEKEKQEKGGCRWSSKSIHSVSSNIDFFYQ